MDHGATTAARLARGGVVVAMLAWMAGSPVRAGEDAIRDSVDCLVKDPSAATRRDCNRKHLIAAFDVLREHHTQLTALLPKQAQPLQRDLDNLWTVRREQVCGVRVPADHRPDWAAEMIPSTALAECLVASFQQQSAELMVHRRMLQAITKGGPLRQQQVPMAAASPALDPAHDEEVRRFWQWVHRFPEDSAPAADPDGRRCALHQSGPLWFLAGNSAGGAVRRTCTVPAGKAVMAPVLAFSVPTELGSCLETRLAVYVDVVRISSMHARLDGTSLPPANWPRMHMACLRHPDGKRGLLVAGWWFYLAPLAVGTHRLEYGVDADSLGVRQQVTYELHVR